MKSKSGKLIHQILTTEPLVEQYWVISSLIDNEFTIDKVEEIKRQSQQHRKEQGLLKKYISKTRQKSKIGYNLSRTKTVNRFWGNAARLEHINVRNKNKGKKR